MSFYKAEIRLKKVAERQLKTKYKGLSDAEKRYIKALERRDQLNKGIDDFFRYAKRDQFGAVDWKNTSAQDLDLFASLNKELDKVVKQVNRIEDGGKLDCEATLIFFRQINIHSQSY